MTFLFDRTSASGGSDELKPFESNGIVVKSSLVSLRVVHIAGLIKRGSWATEFVIGAVCQFVSKIQLPAGAQVADIELVGKLSELLEKA